MRTGGTITHSAVDQVGLELDRIRADFPILSRQVRDGRPLVYLDNAATTQKPTAVIDALVRFYEHGNANVHRALHALAEEATQAYETARGRVARFVGAPTPASIVFTRGTTESINLVAHAWGRKFVGAGDEILVTEMEHHSNLVPWQLLCTAVGARLKVLPVRDDGSLALERLGDLLGPRVKLVAVTHVSNVLGTVNPVARISEAAHGAGALVLVDGAQSVPHMPVDVTDLQCDFLAFSGHKMAGPSGIGALFGKPELLEAMDPFMGGGEMILKVTLEESTWAEVPQRFEAGTPNVAGAVGLGAAVEYLEGIGPDVIRQYEACLTGYLCERLDEVPGLRVVGAAGERSGSVSFVLDGVHPHDIAQFLDREGVAIRAGHMCAQPLMRRLGVPALSRASAYFYNTEEEIDRFVEALLKVRNFFDHGF